MIYNKTLIFTSNIFLFFSKFLNCISNNNGGAILLNIQNFNLSISFCIFFGCRANNGGSIYNIDSSNYFNISYTCFLNSSASYGSIFDSYSKNHFIFFNSFYLSSYQSNICNNIVVRIANGKQYLNNLNSSHTNANHHSGIHQFGSIISNVNFINLVEQKNCEFFFGFHTLSFKPESFYINMINNTISIGLFYLYGLDSVKYYNVIFINNIGSLTANSFYTGKLELYNCYFNTNINSLGNYFLTSSNVYSNIIITLNKIENINNCNYNVITFQLNLFKFPFIIFFLLLII